MVTRIHLMEVRPYLQMNMDSKWRAPTSRKSMADMNANKNSEKAHTTNPSAKYRSRMWKGDNK